MSEHGSDHDHAGHGVTRRLMLQAPAIGMVGSSGSAARPRVAGTANVRDFGAKGDGRTDDGDSIRAALAVAHAVELPMGTFRITRPLELRDGQSLRGAGRSGWEPYTGRGDPAATVRTEILLDGSLAVDARGTNNASITGVSIRALGARQSLWGAEPGFRAETTGIDIAGSVHFEASAISFHGLEIAVASIANSGRSTQMPRIGDWVAHDCGTVFRFVSEDQNFYAVRDARIDSCVGAMHCGRIAEVRKCDGLRIENVRFYQCKTNSLLIERTPFVAITAATLFETGEETVILRDCQYVTMAGVQVARTGFYRAGKLLQKTGLLIENCTDVTFNGLVEQPIGRAMTIRGCVNVSIGGGIGTPFWSTGSLWSEEGAIHVERSRATLINVSFGGTTYWVAVWADGTSSSTVHGRIVTEGTAGTVRCVQLQPPPLGHVARVATAAEVAPGATVTLHTLAVLVPAGKALVSCSVELTIPKLGVAAGQQRLKPLPAQEPGGGSLSIERMRLHTNETAQPRYATLPIALYNPTTEPVMLPAGSEVRLSLAIE